MKLLVSAALCALAAGMAAPAAAQTAPSAEAAAPAYPLTPQGAADFVAAAEKDLFDFGVEYARVQWLNYTYINDTSDALAATYGARDTEKSVHYALEAAKYAAVPRLDAEVKRKLDKLRSRIVMPAPTTEGAADELSQITTRMSSAYGKGQGTLNGKPISGSDIEAEMGELDHTPAEYAEMWTSWHDNVGAPMKDDYVRMVEIGNAGAQELGFSDIGNMWRANYDMPPEEFAALTEKLWQEVKPLYQSLHTYVRWKLNEKYGDAVQPKTGPIRADLLGNMWAQEWGNIYPLVAPPGSGDIGYDLTDLIVKSGKTELDMVKTGENFFSSLGFEPLPETFWTRSMFVKPQDREVICHASAWDLDNVDDLRIKMCIKKNADDFTTIHHELGHNYYQRAYNKQDYLHLDGANDGFHEAIGDMVALSITPANYNQSWAGLKQQYQGITPPVQRSEADFDPGAKFHIPGNTSYERYFIARVLQFQFYKAACEMSGWKGPLHRCSFYGNEEVGKNLNAMLEMGASKPWPDALEAFTGSREMSGKSMAAYFAPLKKWLDQQNKGKPQGW